MELTASNLMVARGGVPVLEGVSFALAPGRALVLRGPNGAGKTTLLRTVAGLQPAMQGEVRGAGERIAYAGHVDGLKTMLSVSENLDFWARVFGSSGIDAALSAFNLVALQDRLAGTLSAGQKRRLGLARLMVTGRPVWVLDEPTVSLDADSVALFAGAVRAHLGQGGSALMATHIDLGIPEADVFDVAPYRAKPRAAVQDEAFL
ncbi:Mn2+/Zn2+ABC transporter ATP-binding protein [Antarctobacter heliothermus]|uniref:Mn2+/Zn2+ABC transporter ATP-binding protein n=1 Tax=Antarctobacter heliothermus TaxID=74033 RepID=A0A222E8M4_9RHOB|nr:heme ABC exporter ATP-binding protein CcmA [Antarctobacter heliothermus]ASP22321.1 Mn2+/Zn2+ABC transporter ATP-binding protein [Antarctobacter heliothermus]